MKSIEPTPIQVLGAIALGLAILLGLFLGNTFLSSSVEAQTPSTLQIGPVEIFEGETQSVPLILSNSPEGIAGFDISVILPSNSVVSIVGASTELALDNIDIFSTTIVHIRAVDFGKVLPLPPSDITLATVELQAVEPGTTSISVIVRRLDDINGTAIFPNTVENTVEVTKSFPTIIGQPGMAQDIDQDGLAEDLNANGRHDFADTLIFFNSIDSIEVVDNIEFFDFYGDGVVTLNDVIESFNLLIK